jgi:hypothetical protein
MHFPKFGSRPGLKSQNALARLQLHLQQPHSTAQVSVKGSPLANKNGRIG